MNNSPHFLPLEVQVQCQVCDAVFWKNISNRCAVCDQYNKWGNYYNICGAYITKDMKLVKWSSGSPESWKLLQYTFWINKDTFKNRGCVIIL